ncbi:hypothetical protein ACF06W_11340 [Streptomyces albus]|uniref:hypothetical protein n=1 Tax=Streptomyces albus TaxID=1888 RepID=UPI0036FEAF5F
MGKAKTEMRKARALARPLALSRMEGRPERSEVAQRVKAESMLGANVPARVVERMGGSTRNVRLSLTDSGPKMRPKRKPRNAGSEAAAAGLIGRGYASKGDGATRLPGDAIRRNREEYFRRAEKSRNARAAEIVARPILSGPNPVAQARADYRNAVSQANKRREAGDQSGYEAWMHEARKHRRMFRNK